MGMHWWMRPVTALAVSLFVTACGPDQPALAGPDNSHDHGGMAASLSPSEVARALNALRAAGSKWHQPDHAAAAGYTVAVGCVDERTKGLPASEARGMGYHTVNPALLDGETSILEPEFLVYVKHPSSGKLILGGLDYFIPGDFYPGPDSPSYAGQPPVLQGVGLPLTWNPVFGAWVIHIWPWWHNPDGMFENYNPAVPLCDCVVTPEAPVCNP